MDRMNEWIEFKWLNNYLTLANYATNLVKTTLQLKINNCFKFLKLNNRQKLRL